MPRVRGLRGLRGAHERAVRRRALEAEPLLWWGEALQSVLVGVRGWG